MAYKIGCLLVLAAFVRAESVPNAAVLASDRLSESWWAARHAAAVEAAKANPETELLLIGDSITNNYDKAKLPDENFQPTWAEFYAPRKALNLGFSGDTTAQVLWRIAHGEVDGLHPKVAVLLIGTNNTGHGQSTEATETGIDAVVADLERRLPETRILLLGILPSAVSDDKTQRDAAVNQYLANVYGEHPRVTYLDIRSVFFHSDGTLNAEIFYDPRLPQHGKPLHPDTVGQHRMAEAIEPTLARLMGGAPRVPLNSMTDINTALIPVDRLEQDSYDWYARHHAELALSKHTQPQVVLIGDSITHFWGGSPQSAIANGPNAWERVFAGVSVMNMGFGWDRTQNVLWRLRQGEFDGLYPRWVVLNIGTNNLTGTSHARANTPEEIVEGINAIIEEVRRRSPESRIVLMSIFPRGKKPDNPFRAAIRKTNELLAHQPVAGIPPTTLVDIGAQFLAADGTLLEALMPDGTHPSDAGYQLWAEALINLGVGEK